MDDNLQKAAMRRLGQIQMTLSIDLCKDGKDGKDGKGMPMGKDGKGMPMPDEPDKNDETAEGE